MEGHVIFLGWLRIGFSAILIAVAGFIFVLLSGIGVIAGIAEGEWAAIAILPAVAFGVASLMTLLAAPGLIGGIGLLKRQRWARVLVIVLGILDLFNFPIGMIVGAYTLWVLMSKETDYYFRPHYSDY